MNIYPSDERITSVKVTEFLKNILHANKDKKVFILNLPPYSPMLNPQENVWNKLKSFFYEYKARPSIDKIKDFIIDYFNHMNSSRSEAISLINGRPNYKQFNFWNCIYIGLKNNKK